MNIIFVGMMGCGKTSVARRCASQLQYHFEDTDKWIEKKEQMTINAIFQTKGEAYFRELETKALESLLNVDNCCLATGGGIILKEENWKLISEIGTSIYLLSDVSHLYKNVSLNKTRPILDNVDIEKKLTELLTVRENHYKRADIIFAIQSKSVKQISSEIISLLFKGKNATL